MINVWPIFDRVFFKLRVACLRFNHAQIRVRGRFRVPKNGPDPGLQPATGERVGGLGVSRGCDCVREQLVVDFTIVPRSPGWVGGLKLNGYGTHVCGVPYAILALAAFQLFPPAHPAVHLSRWTRPVPLGTHVPWRSRRTSRCGHGLGGAGAPTQQRWKKRYGGWEGR